MGEGGYKQINKTLNAPAFEQYLETQQAQLPTLPSVQQLSPRVIRILGQNPGKFTLQGTNTYIVGTGSCRILIDTGQGYPEWAELVDRQLKKFSIRLSQVLLTHWHGDHTGGVPDLIRMYPYLADSIYKNSPDAGQKSIEDGDVFAVEGATLRAVHGDGHAYDHMCFVLSEENAMFTGDNILGHGTTAIEDLGKYVLTLKKLSAEQCEIGYSAHGDKIPDLARKINRELMIKKRREEKCLVALRMETQRHRLAGMTVRELVVAIYGRSLDSQCIEDVLEPFTQDILRKLSEDGKVVFVVRNGVKRWFVTDRSMQT